MTDLEMALHRLAEAIVLLTRAAAADGTNMPKLFRAAVTAKSIVDLLAPVAGYTTDELYTDAYRSVSTPF